MKAIEYRLPKEFDKSFIVFKETGLFFPCLWHYQPDYEFVLVNKSTGRRMVGDHIGAFFEGDLVLMRPSLPHVWVNDKNISSLKTKKKVLMLWSFISWRIFCRTSAQYSNRTCPQTTN